MTQKMRPIKILFCLVNAIQKKGLKLNRWPPTRYYKNKILYSAMGNKIEKVADKIIDKKSEEWANHIYSPSMLQSYPNMTETQIRDHIKLFGAHSLSHTDSKMNKEDFKMLLSGGYRKELNTHFGHKNFKDIAGALLGPLQGRIP
jgi:hypothetical protein